MKSHTMDKYSSPFSYGWGVICTVLGAFSLNEIALLIGIITTVLTCIINWIYKRRDFLHKKKLREQFYEKYNQSSNNNEL